MMATVDGVEVYESKATTTKISATSRASIKVHDNFYTVEFTEERTIPDSPDVDISRERDMLFQDVNEIVDAQVQDIINAFQKKK